VRKVIALPFSFLLLLLLTLFVNGCRTGPNAEDKYKASFEKIWTELAKEQKDLDKKAAAMKNDSLDALILTGESKGRIYKEARKEIVKLSPPPDLKKLHQLMIDYLEESIRYFDEAVRIFRETEGNYSQDQLRNLQKIQKGWISSEEKVKNEMKNHGWTFR
jgi:PBP1b-binding outer membrane lipoprotein LpoB